MVINYAEYCSRCNEIHIYSNSKIYHETDSYNLTIIMKLDTGEILYIHYTYLS